MFIIDRYGDGSLLGRRLLRFSNSTVSSDLYTAAHQLTLPVGTYRLYITASGANMNLYLLNVSTTAGTCESPGKWFSWEQHPWQIYVVSHEV